MFEPALNVCRVSLDLIDFYHNERQMFGVDTRARDATASAVLLELLTPLFDRGHFKPPAIDRILPLSEGAAAYEEVDHGHLRGRLVLAP
jgi:NADPH:quinone reductase-like Zn-dependent oxidoreductase